MDEKMEIMLSMEKERLMKTILKLSIKEKIMKFRKKDTKELQKELRTAKDKLEILNKI